MDLLCEDLEPDMLTLVAPLSREVGEGLPKVREFWWEFSLERDQGDRCRIHPPCQREAPSSGVYDRN